MEDEYKWLTDKNSIIRSSINLLANLMLLGLIGLILIDYDGFKNSLDCQSYQPIIQAAKQCANGVRGDLCYASWKSNSFDIINAGQANLTSLYYPKPVERVVSNGSMVQHANETNWRRKTRHAYLLPWRTPRLARQARPTRHRQLPLLPCRANNYTILNVCPNLHRHGVVSNRNTLRLHSRNRNRRMDIRFWKRRKQLRHATIILP